MRPAFLDRLEHVTPAGDERWRAACPLCGDRRAFSISAGRDRWIANCFAAPRNKAHIREALAIVGLRFDDLLYEREGEHTSAVHEPPPTPPNERAEPELRMLLREHRSGRGRRVPARTPALSADAPLLVRLIYEDMVLRWELRLGADMPEDRPLLYAVSEPVSAGWCKHPTQASRAIHWLEDRGLIWSPGAMPGTGTRTFLPGPRPPVDVLPASALRVEPDVRGRAVDERQEVREEVAVRQAVADDGREVPERDGVLAAPGDGADVGTLHRDHDPARRGGIGAPHATEGGERVHAAQNRSEGGER